MASPSPNILTEPQTTQCSSYEIVPSDAEQKCEYTLRLYGYPYECVQEIVMALQTLTRHKISMAHMVAGCAYQTDDSESKNCPLHHHKRLSLYGSDFSHLAAVLRVGENYVDYEYPAELELPVEKVREELDYCGTDVQLEERPSEQADIKVMRLIGGNNNDDSVEESIERARYAIVGWLRMSERMLERTEQQGGQAMPANKESGQ